MKNINQYIIFIQLLMANFFGKLAFTQLRDDLRTKPVQLENPGVRWYFNKIIKYV